VADVHKVERHVQIAFFFETSSFTQFIRELQELIFENRNPESHNRTNIAELLCRFLRFIPLRYERRLTVDFNAAS
jgi:hypothetical protein